MNKNKEIADIDATPCCSRTPRIHAHLAVGRAYFPPDAATYPARAVSVAPPMPTRWLWPGRRAVEECNTRRMEDNVRLARRNYFLIWATPALPEAR